VENSVCYIGTHDNKPVVGYLKTCSKKDLAYAKLVFGLNSEEGHNFAFIRAGMSSVSKLFIAQMQDYLGLGTEATINKPGTLGNWSWRMKKGAISNKLCEKIRNYTYAFDRVRDKSEKSA
jgi:4-alpha-glucanotransferase